MKKVTIAILLITSFDAFAQNVTKEDLERQIKPLAEKVKTLQSENRKLKTDIGNLNTKLFNSNARVDSLQMQTEANSSAITQSSNELGIKIQQTGKTSEEKITAVDQSLSKNSLYGICLVLNLVDSFWLKKQGSDMLF